MGAISFVLNRSPKEIIAGLGLDEAGVLFLATTWHRLYTPFVPMDTGFLAIDGVSVFADGSRGIIEHAGPYARRQYHGTHHNFSQDKHQLASARWDEAAKSAGKADDLVRDMKAYVKSKNRGLG